MDHAWSRKFHSFMWSPWSIGSNWGCNFSMPGLNECWIFGNAIEPYNFIVIYWVKVTNVVCCWVLSQQLATLTQNKFLWGWFHALALLYIEFSIFRAQQILFFETGVIPKPRPQHCVMTESRSQFVSHCCIFSSFLCESWIEPHQMKPDLQSALLQIKGNNFSAECDAGYHNSNLYASVNQPLMIQKDGWISILKT